MDKLELYINNSTDIYSLVGSITNEGEYRSCCRTLEFTTLKGGKNFSCKVGDTITFRVNNRIQFMGMVTSKSVDTDDDMISFSCKDYGIYLKKNSGTYKFRNASPKSIAERICKDFKIPYSWAHDLNTKVTRNFVNENLYNIIMTTYTLNSDKKFVIQFLEGKLRVLERGTLTKKYIMKDNLISVNATESIDDMVNTVNIYNHEDKLIKTIQNASDRKLYGQFNDYIKLYKDDKKDYVKEANKKLKSVDQKVSVSCLGNNEFTTGKAVIIETPLWGIKGKYNIDSDMHRWENGVYTNKLTLNFKSIMDEHESGELEESKKYKKTTTTTKTTKKSTPKKTTTKKKTSKKKSTEDYSIYTNKLKK